MTKEERAKQVMAQQQRLEELFDRWGSVPVELLPAAVRLEAGRLTAEIEAGLGKTSRPGRCHVCNRYTPRLGREEERFRLGLIRHGQLEDKPVCSSCLVDTITRLTWETTDRTAPPS